MKDLDQTLASLDATPCGTYVFATVQELPAGVTPFAMVQEDEGLTVVVTVEQAKAAGLPTDMTFARITLGVHSALDSVGITATVSQMLASRSIPCNIIAGYYHDHLFVQANQVTEASAILDDLARQAQGWLPGYSEISLDEDIADLHDEDDPLIG